MASRLRLLELMVVCVVAGAAVVDAQCNDTGADHDREQFWNRPAPTEPKTTQLPPISR
jgi:hypothetical protein